MTNPMKKINNALSSLNRRISRAMQLKLQGSKIDLRKDPELRQVVVDYFDMPRKISELRQSLDEAVEEAHQTRRRVERTVRAYKEERRISGEDGSFSKTREHLKIFKEYSQQELIAPDFMEQLQICQEELLAVFRKSDATANKIRKNTRRKKIMKNIFRITEIAAALLSAPIAILLGPAAAPVVVVSHIAIISAVSRLSSRLQSSIEDLKREEEAMNIMKNVVTIELRGVDNMMELASEVRSVCKSVAEAAEMAVERESPVHVAVVDMEKQTKELTRRELDLRSKIQRRDRIVQPLLQTRSRLR